MRTPCLVRSLKRGILLPENSTMDIKIGQGGECLFLAHWLSYEKLNLRIPCGEGFFDSSSCLFISLHDIFTYDILYFSRTRLKIPIGEIQFV